MPTAIDNPLTQEILTQKIWRLMLKFSLPAIIAMSINSLNTFIDALFIGQFVGQEALAAVSLAFPLTMITGGLSAMIGVGGSSLLSIAIGANDVGTQQKIFGSVTILSLICSLLLTVLGFIFAPQLIELMGGTGEIQELGAYYYRIVILGTVFRIYSVVLNMLIRSEGKIKEAMIYSIATTLVNILLNPVLIVWLDMGIAGAAWSTVIAMVLFNIAGLWYFLTKRNNYPVDFGYWKLESIITKPVLSVGVAAMMLQVMFFVQQVFVFRSIAHYGDDWHIAFMGACYRIMLLIILPVFGFAQAMQPVAGINFGAKDYNRVKEAFLTFSGAGTVLIIVLWGLLMWHPEVVLRWMLPNGNFTAQDFFNFRVFNASYPVFPFFFMATTLFQSIGNAKVAGWMLVARELVLFVPFILILPLYFGVNGVYYPILPVNLIMFLVAAWFVKKEMGKWGNGSAA